MVVVIAVVAAVVLVVVVVAAVAVVAVVADVDVVQCHPSASTSSLWALCSFPNYYSSLMYAPYPTKRGMVAPTLLGSLQMHKKKQGEVSKE